MLVFWAWERRRAFSFKNLKLTTQELEKLKLLTPLATRFGSHRYFWAAIQVTLVWAAVAETVLRDVWGLASEGLINRKPGRQPRFPASPGWFRHQLILDQSSVFIVFCTSQGTQGCKVNPYAPCYHADCIFCLGKFKKCPILNWSFGLSHVPVVYHFWVLRCCVLRCCNTGVSSGFSMLRESVTCLPNILLQQSQRTVWFVKTDQQKASPTKKAVLK